MSNYMLLKFGKKEHLESLKQGKIYFNIIESHRNEQNNFRGDALEGKLLLNPQDFDVLTDDGKNIFSHGIPRPDTVTYGFCEDEDFHMICASAVTLDILDPIDDNKYIFKDSFKNEMIKFGDYVSVFFEADLLLRIDEKLKSNGQGLSYYASQKIIYKDKHNFSNINIEDPLDIYFIKGNEYYFQNEWRLIIFGDFKEKSQNAITLCCKPFLNMNIYDAKSFLNEFVLKVK